MAEKDQILKEKLDHSGIFDFADLYKFMHDWFEEEERYGVNEDKYSEKVSGNKRDISFDWTIEKEISDYFELSISMKARISGLTDVEVEIDGKRKKMNKGKISLEIKGVLVKDLKNKWDESNAVYKFLREIYDKYIIPGRIESMEGRVESDVRAFKEEVKAYLELVGKR